MSSDVDDLIRAFAKLLAGSAVLVQAEAAKTDAPDEFWNDWVQANWEAFVEARLGPGLFLEVYGEGADCNGASSRVWMPDAVPTNSVVCVPRNGKADAVRDALSGKDVPIPRTGLALEELVALAGTWYARRPPFDHALVEVGGATHLFKLEDVTFNLAPPTRG